MKLTKTEFKILELFHTFTITGHYMTHDLLGKLYQVDKVAMSEFVSQQIGTVISVDMVEGILEEMVYAGALVNIVYEGNTYYTAVSGVESDVIYGDTEVGALLYGEN
ncbi:MAG: hypothetical protein ACRCW2_11495 [Cellulosilyticaceae bacterium]